MVFPGFSDLLLCGGVPVIYYYACDCGHKFDVSCPAAEGTWTRPCPQCGLEAGRDPDGLADSAPPKVYRGRWSRALGCPTHQIPAMREAMMKRGARDVRFNDKGQLWVQDPAHEKSLRKSRVATDPADGCEKKMVDFDRYA